jgi:hypothetical protein
MRRLMNVVASGRVDLGVLVTHQYKLDDIVEAYDLFAAPARRGAEDRHQARLHPRPRALPAILRPAHRHPRRRHGHHDPALQLGEALYRGEGRAAAGALPTSTRREGQQRAAEPDAPRRDPRHPRALPGRRRRPDRDQHLRRHHHRAGGLRHGPPGARDERGLGPLARAACDKFSARPTSRATWPAPWAPRPRPPASAPT